MLSADIRNTTIFFFLSKALKTSENTKFRRVNNTLDRYSMCTCFKKYSPVCLNFFWEAIYSARRMRFPMGDESFLDPALIPPFVKTFIRFIRLYLQFEISASFLGLLAYRLWADGQIVYCEVLTRCPQW